MGAIVLRVATYAIVLSLLVVGAWYWVVRSEARIDRDALIGMDLNEVQAVLGTPLRETRYSLRGSKDWTPEEQEAWATKTVYVRLRYWSFEVIVNANRKVIEVREL